MTDPFFLLHTDLPREGPGDRASLDWALTLAGTPPDARICDAGCGPGADIEGLLAHAPRGHVTAIDAHAPFVERVRAAWADDARVTAEAADMSRLAGPFDLIWCASAIYSLGIAQALAAWRPALAPGGAVAFSEPLWLAVSPSDGARAFWADYPGITDLAGIHARIDAAGYEPLGHSLLPDAAWEACYTPQEARIARLRPGAGPDLSAVLDAAEAEIEGWRAHRAEFAYAVFVARPA